MWKWLAPLNERGTEAVLQRGRREAVAISERGATVRARAGADALAARYARTRDPRARDDLVAACTGQVRAIAAELASGGAPGDDLLQVGFLGLLNAADHFDPSRGTPFAAFARHYIRGEIQHYLRDHHALVRRPRWLDRLNGEVERAVGEHLSAQGRYPAQAELAARLGIDAGTLAAMLGARRVVRPLSLDAEDADGGRVTEATPGGDGIGRAVEDRVVLLGALGALNPLQRAVVFLVYFTDLTQAQAAARLGVSQKHVSRVLASALHRLRFLLRPEAPAG